MFCPYCGKPITSTHGFCPHCGSRIDDGAPDMPDLTVREFPRNPQVVATNNMGDRVSTKTRTTSKPPRKMLVIGIAAALLCAVGALAVFLITGAGQTHEEKIEAKRVERTHWWPVETRTHYEFADDPEHKSSWDMLSTYERDEHGNTTKYTFLSYDYDEDNFSEEFRCEADDASSVTKSVVEYTYDDKGWPVVETERTGYNFSSSEVLEEDMEEPEETTFEYERDSDDRVTKIVAEGERNITMEFAYDASGWPSRIKRTEETRDYEGARDGEDITQTVVREFKDGKAVTETLTKVDESGTVYYKEVTNYDEHGDPLKRFITRTQEDGTDALTTYEYKNEYVGDNLSKVTTWVYGDGVSVEETYVDHKKCQVTYMEDGSVTVREILEGSSDEEPKLGKEKTYPGPNLTEQYGYDNNDNMLSYGYRSFDDTWSQQTNEYDEHGNWLVIQIEHDDSTDWFDNRTITHVDEPSEFMREFYRMELQNIFPNIA